MGRHSISVISLIALAVLACLAPAGVDAKGGGSLLAPEDICGGQLDFAAPVSQQKQTMACMHDYARRHAGGRKYRSSFGLSSSAEQKAADIASCNDYSHTACGKSTFSWLRRLGCESAAENLGWYTGESGSVRATMASWLASPHHRRNILNPTYRKVGFGLATGPEAGLGEELIWVTHFAGNCG